MEGFGVWLKENFDLELNKEQSRMVKELGLSNEALSFGRRGGTTTLCLFISLWRLTDHGENVEMICLNDLGRKATMSQCVLLVSKHGSECLKSRLRFDSQGKIVKSGDAIMRFTSARRRADGFWRDIGEPVRVKDYGVATMRLEGWKNGPGTRKKKDVGALGNEAKPQKAELLRDAGGAEGAEEKGQVPHEGGSA